jgi:hypothetical protein
LLLKFLNGVGDKCPNSHRSKSAVIAYGSKEDIAKYNSWCTNTKEGGDGFVNRSTSSLDKFESFWKSREEDEVDPVSTHPESSESVGGAANGGKSDIIKCAGTVITEVFDRIDMRLKHLKALGPINSDDDVQSELPVESAITVDVENTTCCDNIFDEESEVERSDILKSASLLISGGARRHSYGHPTGSNTKTKMNHKKRTKGTKKPQTKEKVDLALTLTPASDTGASGTGSSI